MDGVRVASQATQALWLSLACGCVCVLFHLWAVLSAQLEGGAGAFEAVQSCFPLNIHHTRNAL